MTTHDPRRALLDAAMQAAQAVAEIGSQQALELAFETLSDALDLTLLLNDDGSDPDAWVTDVEVEDAIALRERIGEQLHDAPLCPACAAGGH